MQGCIGPSPSRPARRPGGWRSPRAPASFRHAPRLSVPA